ncbi:uncharacterized protein [Triticum aestivum]|uniref:uncharacterized protein n=1 Tax=Triticum aestivum TaxID=4565 RepID=UPI00098A3D85|nr:uncharacterized protein LOC123076800 [Triticum aestivum]
MGVQQPQEKELKEGGVGERRKVAVAAVIVTMNLGILDCPICFHPLQPPIFQLIDIHKSTSNWDQPSWWAKMGNLLLVNMMLVPLRGVISVCCVQLLTGEYF